LQKSDSLTQGGDVDLWSTGGLGQGVRPTMERRCRQGRRTNPSWVVRTSSAHPCRFLPRVSSTKASVSHGAGLSVGARRGVFASMFEDAANDGRAPQATHGGPHTHSQRHARSLSQAPHPPPRRSTRGGKARPQGGRGGGKEGAGQQGGRGGEKRKCTSVGRAGCSVWNWGGLPGCGPSRGDAELLCRIVAA